LTGVPSKAFLAQDAERDLVGDRLADQRGAASSSVCTAQACRVGKERAGRPIVVAAAGRHARNVEQVLGGEAERPR